MSVCIVFGVSATDVPARNARKAITFICSKSLLQNARNLLVKRDEQHNNCVCKNTNCLYVISGNNGMVP